QEARDMRGTVGVSGSRWRTRGAVLARLTKNGYYARSFSATPVTGTTGSVSCSEAAIRTPTSARAALRKLRALRPTHPKLYRKTGITPSWPTPHKPVNAHDRRQTH